MCESGVKGTQAWDNFKFFLPKSNPYVPLVNFRKIIRFFSFDFCQNFEVRTFSRWLSIRGTKYFWRHIPKGTEGVGFCKKVRKKFMLVYLHISCSLNGSFYSSHGINTFCNAGTPTPWSFYPMAPCGTPAITGRRRSWLVFFIFPFLFKFLFKFCTVYIAEQKSTFFSIYFFF